MAWKKLLEENMALEEYENICSWQFSYWTCISNAILTHGHFCFLTRDTLFDIQP